MPEKLPEVDIPQDLALVPLDDLRSLLTAATAEWDALEAGEVTTDTVERAMKLSAGILRVKDEIEVKEKRDAQAEARKKQELADQMKDLGSRVKPPADADGGKTAGSESPEAQVGLTSDFVEQIVAAAVQGVATVLVASDGGRKTGELVKRASSGTLADAQRHVPDPQVPDKQLVVTASVDVPGRAQGDRLSFDDLVDAYHKRAKHLEDAHRGIATGPTVATIRNEYAHTVDDRTPPGTVDELFRYLATPDVEALLAGGGWCAPSEIRYEFFNVACFDGLVDLPTVGVTRGGLQFPTSPSLADIQAAPFVSAFSNASTPFLWTESDDILTVTGTTNKPCLRIPCVSFTERRLECYGICLTSGNLQNDAYPENTANFLRLVLAAHEHAMNARTLAVMQSLSSGATTLVSGSKNAFSSIIGGAALAAADYRARYGMCNDDVLELVIPYWVLDAIQADLGWHTGDYDLLSVTKAQIRSLLADRNIRPQFVNDWQVRGAGQFGNASAMTAWPTTVDFMLYAAGTFIRGNGLTLDLGVVRDSLLNSENDFTAAWSEECHLVARVGHESRRYTVPFNVGGTNSVTAAAGPGL